MNNRQFIPFHRASIGEQEINEVVDTLRSGWLTTGPKTEQFEREFREYVQAPQSLAVNSCTAGLHLALDALGLNAEDEVITTPLTFCATVHTIVHTGATPVLADIGKDGNIDPDSVEERITARTKAIVPVHFAGMPCDMDRLWAIARKHDLKVVEDAAHAVGAIYKGQPIGACSQTPKSGSDAVAFSFYATKNLTTGEGGMLTMADPELYSRMKCLCLHGISRDAWNRYSEKGSWYYEVHESGFKYNLSDVQSAIGIHQLRRQEEFVQARARYAELYRELLSDLAELELPADVPPGSRHAWHLYCVRLNLQKLRIARDEFIQNLRERQIGTSVHFIPINLHPFFRARAAEPRNDCPTVVDLYPRLMTLPLYPAMTEEDVRYVASSVREVVYENRVRAVKGGAARSYTARFCTLAPRTT